MDVEFKNGDPGTIISPENARDLAETLVAEFIDPEIYHEYLAVRHILGGVFPPEVEDCLAFVEGQMHYLMNIISKPETIIATANGKIVGTGFYKHLGKSKDGRDVLLLQKAITLPEFQGQGIYKEITQRRLGRIREGYVHPILLTLTKNEKVKASYLQKGFREISLREYHEFLSQVDTSSNFPSEEDLRAAEKQGLVGMIKDMY